MNTAIFLKELKINPLFNAFDAPTPEDWEIEMTRDRCPFKFLVDIWGDADIVRKRHAEGDSKKLERALQTFHGRCNTFYAAYDDPYMREEMKISEWLLHEAASSRNEFGETMDSAMSWFDQWVYGFNHKAAEEEWKREQVKKAACEQ